MELSQYLYAGAMSDMPMKYYDEQLTCLISQM